jgi:hypothetical protein
MTLAEAGKPACARWIPNCGDEAGDGCWFCGRPESEHPGSAPAGSTTAVTDSSTAGEGRGASAKDAGGSVAPAPPQLLVDDQGELEVAVGGAEPVPLASWLDGRAQRDKEGENRLISGGPDEPPGGAANEGVDHGR